MAKHKILVVDDHPLVRGGIVQLLSHDSELEICGEAATRAEVISALEACHPDAVLLDLSLGEGLSSGLDLIPEIHARAGRIPILVLSMRDEMFYGQRVRAAGAQGFISKREPVRQVGVALRTVLAGESYFGGKACKGDAVGGADIGGGVQGGLASLSLREFEVFRLMGEGLPPRAIADQLHLSARTVEVHRANVRHKLGLSSAEELIRYAVDWRCSMEQR